VDPEFPTGVTHIINPSQEYSMAKGRKSGLFFKQENTGLERKNSVGASGVKNSTLPQKTGFPANRFPGVKG
jgi:hypothetical protein